MEIPDEPFCCASSSARTIIPGLHPLYEAIVFQARAARLAGATVLRGPLGFGAASHLHQTHLPRLSRDLPMVIEIVDSEENINTFLPTLDGLFDSGLVTLENVHVLRYQDKIHR